MHRQEHLTTASAPDDKIRPATFDPDAYSKILSQECMGHDANVMWYTCTGTTPPFLGCCAVNPCAKGSCPQSALKPARLSSNEKNASSFLEGISSTTTSTTATVTPTTTEPAKASGASATPSASTPAGGSRKAMQPATVAGIAIGITAGFLAIALLIFWLAKRRRARAKRDAIVAAAVLPMHPNADCTSPLSPVWLYSASPAHQTNSSSASEYHRYASDSPKPTPPDYETVTTKNVGPAELPGNFCFELDGDSPQSPHSR
ncbi:hypothetical protein NLG97_g3978 [Lecanicillium saksenae]|uniref:Uncharacterized protein n=1 Tax=Lecanicillium saksenae TaxID=468837 RepID=A0ACC1QXZ4_9HYPO|nr:hypothetical protein NLG97_g3978 [Lecanicillium saksenae]